jgi:hypothetical protein
MAFRKFTRANYEAEKASRPTGIDLDDRTLFSGKKISRGTVDLTWDRRFQMSGDIEIVGRADRGQDFLVHFSGARADIYKQGLGEILHAQWSKICDDVLAGKRDWPEQGDTAITLIIEGAWEARYWRDRNGNQRKSWELVVARWHFREDPQKDALVEHGRLPVLEEAVTA